jgi:hypothetical protein
MHFLDILDFGPMAGHSEIPGSALVLSETPASARFRFATLDTYATVTAFGAVPLTAKLTCCDLDTRLAAFERLVS